MNIVFISVDTLARSLCPPFAPSTSTPRLAELAARGTSCSRAYCASPLCTPARAAWYTGLIPGLAGAPCNNLSLRRSVALLPELLQQAGYHCVHVGKWHLDGFHGHEGAGLCDGGFTEPWYDQTNFMDEVGRDGPEPKRFGNWNKGHQDPKYCFGSRVADHACEQLRRHDFAKPLFLAVEFDEPHGPYIAPPPYAGQHPYEDLHQPESLVHDLADKPQLQQQMSRFLKATRQDPSALPQYYRYYHDCLAFVDACIGRVCDAVRQHAPADTAILFTADHGDHMGHFGLGPKGGTMYESCIGVPLILEVPSVTRPGQVFEGLVSGMDVFATLADCAGMWPAAKAPRSPGHSLLSQLRDQQQGPEHVVVSYDRFGISQQALQGFHPIRCITNRSHKLVINLFDTDELYDLVNDPEELVNLIDDPQHAPCRDALHAALVSWQRRYQDPLAGDCWYRRPWSSLSPPSFQALNPTGYREATSERPFA